MLAANVCASDTTTRESNGVVPRPRLASEDKLMPAFLRVPQGVRPRLGGDEPRAADFARLLKQVKDRPTRCRPSVLRSLKRAMYSPDNVRPLRPRNRESLCPLPPPPIRRYPDPLIHRGIRPRSAGEQVPPRRLGADRPALLDDRAPRRRRHPRRGRLPQSAASCRTASARSRWQRVGGGAFRSLRGASTTPSRAAAHLRSRQRLLPPRRDPPCAHGWSAPASSSACPTGSRCSLVRVDMATNKIDFPPHRGPLRSRPKPRRRSPKWWPRRSCPWKGRRRESRAARRLKVEGRATLRRWSEAVPAAAEPPLWVPGKRTKATQKRAGVAAVRSLAAATLEPAAPKAQRSGRRGCAQKWSRRVLIRTGEPVS